MYKAIKLGVFFLLLASSCFAQSPNPSLVGYWQNWNDVNAPYIQLDAVDARYNIVNVAFAVPHQGTDFQMEFIPDQVSSAALIAQIQNLQGQGKKVVISIGGATAPISLDNTAERDTFVSTMNSIINFYGFDGMDIDLEGASLSLTGGTITNPVDAKIINLIDAIKEIMSDYYGTFNKRMILSMAPETAFVQGGMSAYAGIFGAYLPVINALRDSLELLHVQLYNSGSMFGIDGNIYSQGTADFIVAMTEAVLQGFNTAGGNFAGLPANKVVVGLPACPNAAGGGYTDTATVSAAINYLRGAGPQPGSYILTQTNGYPGLRGMMTWSINWDAVTTCASEYQYADNYEILFGTTTAISELHPNENGFSVMPNPSSDFITIQQNSSTGTFAPINIYNYQGVLVDCKMVTTENQEIDISDLKNGIYFLQVNSKVAKFIKCENNNKRL